MPFHVPSGLRSSRRNSESARLPSPAPSGRANASEMSAVVADVNHFVPCKVHQPSPASRASVPVRPTSEPPSFSVIHWPLVHAFARAVSFGT